MKKSRTVSAVFFGMFVVCAIVACVARLVDCSSRAHPAETAPAQKRP